VIKYLKKRQILRSQYRLVWCGIDKNCLLFAINKINI